MHAGRFWRSRRVYTGLRRRKRSRRGFDFAQQRICVCSLACMAYCARWNLMQRALSRLGVGSRGESARQRSLLSILGRYRTDKLNEGGVGADRVVVNLASRRNIFKSV